MLTQFAHSETTTGSPETKELLTAAHARVPYNKTPLTAVYYVGVERNFSVKFTANLVSRVSQVINKSLPHTVCSLQSAYTSTMKSYNMYAAYNIQSQYYRKKY